MKKRVVVFGVGGKLPILPNMWNHSSETMRQAAASLNARHRECVSFQVERMIPSHALHPYERFINFRQQIEKVMKQRNPHAVMLADVSDGSSRICLETTARNIFHWETLLDYSAEIQNIRLIDDGKELYQSALPLTDWCAQLQKSEMPVSLSGDAGQLVSNAVYYTALHASQHKKVVFVHLPYTPEQADSYSARTKKQVNSVKADIQLRAVMRIMELLSAV